MSGSIVTGHKADRRDINFMACLHGQQFERQKNSLQDKRGPLEKAPLVDLLRR